jgi:hypothetical protein
VYREATTAGALTVHATLTDPDALSVGALYNWTCTDALSGAASTWFPAVAMSSLDVRGRARRHHRRSPF